MRALGRAAVYYVTLLAGPLAVLALATRRRRPKPRVFLEPPPWLAEASRRMAVELAHAQIEARTLHLHQPRITLPRSHR